MSITHRMLRFVLLTIGIVALSRNGSADAIMTGTITISGNSIASVEKGPYMRGGETLITTDAQLAARQAHAAQYDGATAFTAEYNIVLKADGTVDTTKSTITFTTIFYTDQGQLAFDNPPFKTDPITIQDVTLNEDKSISGFSFQSVNWYPANANGAGLINNVNLWGSIDLSSGESQYWAQYSSKSAGAIYTYYVTGRVLEPPINLGTPAACPDVSGCAGFLTPLGEIAAPEPSSWILMLTGLVGIGLLTYHRTATA